MKIGIDIDDTITSFSEIYYAGVQKWCLENGVICSGDQNLLSNNILDYMLDTRQIWKEVMFDTALNIECRSNAKEVINKLLNEGHEIYLITARSNDLKKDYTEKTLEWLKKKNIKYTDVYFSAGNKIEALTKLNIDVMIDDNIQVMDNTLSLNKKGIIMNTMFNGNYCKCDRAYTWYDVYRKG